jgi:hypothetical protein
LPLRLAWIGLLGALVCATLYAVSIPGWYFELTLAVIGAWILVGVSWLVSVGAWLLRRRPLVWTDTVAPALILVVGALVYSMRRSRLATASAAPR